MMIADHKQAHADAVQAERQAAETTPATERRPNHAARRREERETLRAYRRYRRASQIARAQAEGKSRPRRARVHGFDMRSRAEQYRTNELAAKYGVARKPRRAQVVRGVQEIGIVRADGSRAPLAAA